MRIIVIGAGPGGIAAGKRLREAGFDDLLILEQAAGIGGTWWHNVYPGCRCDVPSHLYSFSFAPKADWSAPFAPREEIQRYLEDCVDRFDLRRHIHLNSKVVEARWQPDTATWAVRIDTGETFTADIVIGAVGLFNEPAYPAIEGLASFTGEVMHSARWRPEVELAGRRVAAIGSAASAVQFVPSVAHVAARLDVYQRTPNYIGPRDNVFAAGVRERLMRDPAAATAERQRIWDWLEAVVTLDDAELLGRMSDAALANLETIVDPALRARFTPDYPFGSKRGLSSSDWYPSFNLDSVSLVTEPIARIDGDAIVTTDGVSRPVDVILLATGFETTRFLSAIPVTGRDGARLDRVWEHGARAYLGITVAGFPNLFMLFGPNTNNGSIIEQIENQVNYIVRKLVVMQRGDIAAVEVKTSALDAYNERLQEDISRVAVWQTGTRDYYRAAGGLLVTQWPHSMARYREETLREDDDAYAWSPARGEPRGGRRGGGLSAPRREALERP